MADVEGWEARMAARRAGAWSNIDIGTAEGQATRRDVLEFVSDLVCHYQEAVDGGLAREDAGDDYRVSLDLLSGRMSQDGLTAGQVEELLGKYRWPDHG